MRSSHGSDSPSTHTVQTIVVKQRNTMRSRAGDALRDRERGRERDRAAHAGERDDERPVQRAAHVRAARAAASAAYMNGITQRKRIAMTVSAIASA